MLPDNMTGDEFLKHIEERAKIVHERYSLEQEALDKIETREAMEFAKTATDEDIEKMMTQAEFDALILLKSICPKW